MKTPRDVIIRPVVSEKSYAGLEQNTYTFLVDPRANKTEIKEAVQVIWNVQVISVRTLNRTGKVKRRRYTLGKRGASQAETRRRIVEAALRLYREVGVDGATVPAVARAADATSSTSGATRKA